MNKRGCVGLLSSFLLATYLAWLPVGVYGFGSHSNVVSTNPRAGATLTTVPKQMVFKFSDGIIDRGTTFTFTDRTKMYYPPLEFRPKGTTVGVSLPKNPAPGPITVYYRVLSADGHPVQGKVEMTYAPPWANSS